MSYKMGATSEQVKKHIPDDLAFCILSKFPLRSLKRFGCVHKSWALLLENPYFMKIFSNNFISKHHSYYDDTYLLLNHEKLQPLTKILNLSLYSLFGKMFECRVNLERPNPFHYDNTSFCILNPRSINGILCLYTSVSAILWNPTTEEFKALPPSPVESITHYRDNMINFHGFGYDYVKDDYKVIRHILFYELTDQDVDRLGLKWEDVPWEDICYDSLWEMYSLKSNSWRKLDVDMPTGDSCLTGCNLYKDGMCHWLRTESFSDAAYVVSFDLSNEVSFTTPTPLEPSLDMGDNFSGDLIRGRNLLVLNGSLALISNYMDRTLHIYILGEIGEKESWTRLFTVGPFPCIEEFIGAWKNDIIFFKKKNDELVCFDLSTQMIEEVGFNIERYRFCQIIMYTESLLPIGAIHN